MPIPEGGGSDDPVWCGRGAAKPVGRMVSAIALLTMRDGNVRRFASGTLGPVRVCDVSAGPYEIWTVAGAGLSHRGGDERIRPFTKVALALGLYFDRGRANAGGSCGDSTPPGDIGLIVCLALTVLLVSA
jgi:hypothetical protein